MPVEIVHSRRGLRNRFDQFDDDIREYFSEFRTLLDSKCSLNVLLAYMFFRLEQGERMTLYCGARKVHKTNAELTWKAIDNEHLTRKAFQERFKNIFSVPVPAELQEIIRPAEDIRDNLMHGVSLDEAKLRDAINRVLCFADEINKFMDAREVGFRPFVGDLRGFVGRLQPHDKSSSRLILKGLGFDVS